MENETLNLILSEVKDINDKLDNVRNRIDKLEVRIDDLEDRKSKKEEISENKIKEKLEKAIDNSNLALKISTKALGMVLENQ